MYTHSPVTLAVQESDLLEPGVHAVGIAASVAVRELRRAEDRQDVELVLVVDGDVLPRLGHSGEVRQSANHAARRRPHDLTAGAGRVGVLARAVVGESERLDQLSVRIFFRADYVVETAKEYSMARVG